MAAIAIIHFANAPKGQSRSGMAGTMDYAAKEEKTMWQPRRVYLPDARRGVRREVVRYKEGHYLHNARR